MRTTKSFYPIQSVVNEMFSLMRELGSSTQSSVFYRPNVKSLEIPFKVPGFPVSNCYLQEDGTLNIEVAMTGFDREDISIKAENNTIIIEGRVVDEDYDDKRSYLWQRIKKSDFEMEIPVGPKANLDSISARVEKGILKISVPLKEEAKPITRQIEIQ